MISDLGVQYLLPEISANLSWLDEIVAMSTFDKIRLTVIPEPGTGLLIGLGLVIIAAGRLRRRLPLEREPSRSLCEPRGAHEKSDPEP